MNKKALKIEQLHVAYEKNPVLWDISLEVPSQTITAIVGPNGAGKSTLLKAALKLLKPISGKVEFFGEEIENYRKKIAYIPQRESVDWDFPITVLDLVLMGRFGSMKLFQRVSKKDKEEALKTLEKVGLEPFAKRQISQLSGGQQQRAFLARALFQDATIYFMDEPFTGIDVASSKTIVSLLHELKREGKTLFAVHHDLSSVPQIFDWVILLNLRLVACGEVAHVFTPELIQKTYGTESALFDEATRLSQEKKQGLLFT